MPTPDLAVDVRELSRECQSFHVTGLQLVTVPHLSFSYIRTLALGIGRGLSRPSKIILNINFVIPRVS